MFFCFATNKFSPYNHVQLDYSILSPTTPSPDLAGWKKRVEVGWNHPAPWLDHVFDSPTLALTRPEQEKQQVTGTFLGIPTKMGQNSPPQKKKHTKRDPNLGGFRFSSIFII